MTKAGFSALELLLQQLIETTTSTQEAVGQVKESIAVINATLKGPNGDNGINGRLQIVEKTVRELAEEVKSTNVQLLDYWSSKRELTCFGMEALTRDKEERVKTVDREEKIRIEEAKERQKQNNQFRIALVSMLGTTLVALITTGASVYTVNQSKKKEATSVSIIDKEPYIAQRKPAEYLQRKPEGTMEDERKGRSMEDQY